MTPFEGTGVALVTPFHKYGTIDFTSLGNIIEHVINGGVSFIVAMGTTSEAATMMQDEREAAISFIVDQVQGRVPIVLGLGSNNTATALTQLKSIDFEGISGLLSVVPYYNKPQQKGLYYHFKNIATVSPVPVILYNVPGRTSANLDVDTALRLAHDFENIVAIKEASGDLEQIMELIKGKPEGFSVLSGDDLLTLPMLALGATGVISVVANAFPQAFSEMVRLQIACQTQEALRLHYALMKIIQLLFIDGNPSGVKAALEILGLLKNNLRLPLVKVNKGVYNQLNEAIMEINEVI